jgi:hypothetical protein
VTVRAILLFRSGDFAAARVRFQSVVEAIPPTDRESYLDALSNLISAQIELREAGSEVEQALALLIGETRH